MLVFLLALAQPPDPPAKPADPAPKAADPKAKPPAGPPEFEVQFTDGGNIRAVILDAAVTVTTKFGKLDIPFSELRKVDIGFRYPPGVEAQVAQAVARLGAPAFRDREEAERDLLAQKEFALPAVRRAAKGGDPEVVRRAEPLVRKLLAVVPEDRQQGRDFDVVETHDFTVKGRLELATMRVLSKQFGEVPVKVDMVRAFRALAAPAGVVELTLDAAQYARQGWTTWLDTGVDVDPLRGVEITAAGTIDQWAQEPGKYMSGPAGTQAQVPGPPGPQNGMQPVPGQPGVMMRNGMMGRPFQSGMLVGRVGPAGVPFPVGADFRQPKAGVGGRLFLVIAPSNWNNDSAGTYKVKIKLVDQP